ncbi:hypothetical protein LG651_03500 [Tamlana sp. 62-3]|uniref:Polysaccharide biosynthesis protein n=1 Tax=Neotamlana sargassicola TaxID=2883125 RepID=A0A9X1L718_9FLAO|nr:MATE family efflux transporter [Tamlana sargassicola]MCB4807303.1 hypothetical protein [Tamlana sargassicola]
MKGTDRVLFNTAITYAKAIVTSIVSLYATRLILNSLGAADFGIYNVVGGMIAMLSFLNAAMTTSTQRYLSYSLGTGSFDKVKTIFGNSIIIHFFLALIVVILIEVVGVYLIKKQLVIAPEKVQTALWILHFLAISTFFTIITVPYNAVINAHENMTFLAVLGIVEAFLKLVVAFSLSFFVDNRLFFYGLLIMLCTIFRITIKCIYSKKKYEECNTKVLKSYEPKEIKELTSFASWNLFGTLCALGRNQGVSVILNLFYTTIVNAAYGIASQINSQLMFFSQTLMSALRPQIMKSEGAKNRSRMIKLALTANKLSFFLFTLFAIPLFFEMPLVLKFWLKDVPNYSVEFCRAIILLTMMNQINMGLMSAVQAIGEIKVYQIVAGSVQLLTLPLGFVVLKLGYEPYSIILISFGLEVISTVFRMFYFKYLTGFSVKTYFISVIFTSFSCLFIILVVIWFFKTVLNLSGVYIIALHGLAFILYGIIIYFVGLSKDEKQVAKGFITKLKLKLKK